MSWLAAKLISALIFVALAVTWTLMLSFLFKASGLRACFQGADDIWIAAMTILFLVLMIPVFIAHDRIMKRIRCGILRAACSKPPATPQQRI
jgi:membrane protease YdiL (CAAX protease family)